ncbi:hypothetical protein V6N13_126511 [Hibiscus sabdariffa]
MGRQQIFNLFIGNLSEKIHWKGLWHAFGIYGVVLDAFIARKRDSRGRRFGFVRYRNRYEAERAIERINNSVLIGSIISVSMARFNLRQSFWRKVRTGKMDRERKESKTTTKMEGKDRMENRDNARCETVSGESKEEDRKGEFNWKDSDVCKRIKGTVHTEDLWKYKRCLVGTMSNVCSVRSIMLRMQEWGLAEIDIKRLDGKSYLLSFDNDELYTMLEDVNWSYLKEIFLEVHPWTEKARYDARATWLELFGLPLHCWNHETIKRLAELWGSFEALGENANKVIDCESISVLITTSHVRRIEENVEIEVGDDIYVVRVREIGFKDDSSGKTGTTMKEERRTECKVKVDSCESSSSSSESQHDKAAEPESESHRGKEEDELNAVVLGNLNNHDNSCDIVELNSRLEESEMKGINAKNNKINQHILSREEDITASIQRFDGVESKVFVADNWQKVESVKSKVTKRIVEEKRELSPVGVSQRAWDDLCDMGLGLQMKSTGKNKDKGISSRATAVENKENVGLILGTDNSICFEQSRDSLALPFLSEKSRVLDEIKCISFGFEKSDKSLEGGYDSNPGNKESPLLVDEVRKIWYDYEFDYDLVKEEGCSGGHFLVWDINKFKADFKELKSKEGLRLDHPWAAGSSNEFMGMCNLAHLPMIGEMRKSLLRKGLVSRFFFFITKAIALVRAKASKEDSFEHIEFWWERSLIFFIVEDKYCVEGSSQWKDSARSYLVAWVLGGAMGCGGFLRTNEVQCSGLDFVELLVLKMVADCL